MHYDPENPASFGRIPLRKNNGGAGPPLLAAPVALEAPSAADIKPRGIISLWPERIYRGKLNALIGDPDAGKTCVAIDIASHVTRGTAWPDGSPCPQGSVLFLSAEDDAADTLVPRLIAAGADRKRVRLVSGASLSSIDALRDLIDLLMDVALIVFDPVAAFVGGIDTHRDAPVRELLAPLAKLAEGRNAAVLLIAHLNKNAAASALYRAGGSIGWVAACRAVWLVARDRDDETGGRRLLLPVKNNLARNPGGLAFEITGHRLRELAGAEVARVKWIDGVVHTTAAETLAPLLQDHAERGATKVEAAAAWLRGLLAQGPVPALVGEEQGREAGFKKDHLQRARERIGASSAKDGRRGWVWSLPGTGTADAEGSGAGSTRKRILVRKENHANN